MEHNTYMIILYDFYKNLLNEKEQLYFEEYYFNNLTLQEIADNLEVSKNNVHKTLKMVENKLNEYESSLELFKKNNLLMDLIENLDEKTKDEIKNIFN